MVRLLFVTLIILSSSPFWAWGGIQDSTTNDAASAAPSPTPDALQNWSWHIQNTDIAQGYPAFSAKYTNPGFHSLPTGGQIRSTVSLDLMAGIRLWSGAEGHIDGLMWQGFGVNNTLGVEAFPSAEAYRLGTRVPNGIFARLFVRQTIGLGGDKEAVDADPLRLAGRQDVSRVTITVGRMSAADIFDNNTYANNPRTQFLNWALVNNEAWDYAADAVGYTTGAAVELNQPRWALRYGFFQMPRVQNSLTADDRIWKWPTDNSAGGGKFWKSWSMPLEFEHRWQIKNHPGKIRLLAYLNEANIARYTAAITILQDNGPGADTTPARAYHFKYGFGLNWEQEITSNVGVFSRFGWSDGHTESWAFADVDRTVTLGVSVKGASWKRPDDTFGLGSVINGISKVHQEFFADGGLGILGGDGALNYGREKTLETYYDLKVWKTVHGGVDYQFVSSPAFNRDRGPVHFFGVRMHWDY